MKLFGGLDRFGKVTMDTIEFKNRAEWRAWLRQNHDRVSEIWLIYNRKETGIPSISYEESLDEALCFGWVDSLIKKLDEARYVRKFTPRNDNSQWSQVNKSKVEHLISTGQMTEHGLKKVQAAKISGSWDHPVKKPEMKFEMPAEFTRALQENPRAAETFHRLAGTYQMQYIAWIAMAKKPETRIRRIEEAVHLLTDGKKLGLK